METILRILPVLVCPIMIGLLMWVVMRNNGNNRTTATAIQQAQGMQQPNRASFTNASPFRVVVNIIKCCLNPKVIVVLGVAGVGLWLFVPNALVAALPVLLVLVCPISMLLMALSMNSKSNSHCAAANEQTKQKPQLPVEVML